VCYAQGRTFSSSFVILDESQCLDLSEWEMVCTRLGQDSKMVITGSFRQDTRNVGGIGEFLEATKEIEGIGYYNFPDDTN
ncbi:PhoH family protein, partial [Pseudomonas glycinae]|uniref:PhoH family protein n=1 Tax=Pseudomonas glycinae TaxID=1785145 RepID=UPI003B001003